MEIPQQGAEPSHKILIATAVEAEREAIERGLPEQLRLYFDVQAVGVGPAAAAAGTAVLLARGAYKLVISAGIGGGFAPYAPIGSIVLASQLHAADLGSEMSDGGFIPVDELGFGSSVIPAAAQHTSDLEAALRAAGLEVYIGPILTVSTTTGSQLSTDQLSQRIPGAAAEGMEGFGVGEAARVFDLPVMELRAISNQVGPRDRDSWRIPQALQALTQASRILAEVL